ncbi:subtilase-type protease inhibitor [Paenarthrobacter sp. JL.01a]|uniref:subtilase-type protease inhibitor n=1 Tax=Paenarthrobacter sp. JL.01a TaxID=2979324 RepID=UPI0021CA39CE|nr:subtilase-type protease inhibitor [Paenarthrobacter sp. JL.01a]UXM92287.1 subtilase-type protease inhibitor [Paenarthrobacter sp. JL.01a]
MRLRFVRPLLAVFAVAGLAACSSTPAPGSSGSTSPSPSSATSSSPSSSPAATAGRGDAQLSITLRETPDASPQNFTLVCTGGVPAAESKHPSPAEACAAIKNNPAMLSPAPPRADRACTMQFGGPATATVTGSVDGKEVTAAFNRTDGCQIGMWDAAKSVLGSDGGH